MYINGASSTEVVIAPHFLKKYRPGENPTGVLSKKLQKFKFLEREVKGAAAYLHGVTGFVNKQVTGANFFGESGIFWWFNRRARAGKPKSRFKFCRRAGVEDDVVDSPIPLDCSEPAFSCYQQHGNVEAGLAKEAGEAANSGKVAAAIDEQCVAVRCAQDCGWLSRQGANVVREQPESRENLRGGLHGSGEQEQAH
jgi:hypothetical protein